MYKLLYKIIANWIDNFNIDIDICKKYCPKYNICKYTIYYCNLYTIIYKKYV